VYRYAAGNPMKYSDPRGEQTLPFTSPLQLPFEYDPSVDLKHLTDPFHHFPRTFDPHIWYDGRTLRCSLPKGRLLGWGYYECRCVDGSLNGEQGRYEIGVVIPYLWESPFGLGRRKPTVVHRVFIPRVTCSNGCLN